MSYLGQVELKSSDIRRVDVTSSTSATHTLTWTPPSEQSLIVTINGIKQQNNYTISGTTLTLDSALVSTDELEVVGILDIGVTNIPADDSITTAMVKDDAVTADKLADAINTSIAANTAKVTNATHTGDVTGATALTIAVDAVDIAMLSATGTAGATTFLRGDNAWASAGVSNKVVAVHLSSDQSLTKNVIAKVQFDVEDLDANGWFDNSTNYRFTPDEAGDYFFSCELTQGNGTSSGDATNLYFYKNGSEVFSNETGSQSGYLQFISGSAIINLNGSSDYVEVYTRSGANGTLTLDAQGFNASTATNCRLCITRLT